MANTDKLLGQHPGRQRGLLASLGITLAMAMTMAGFVPPVLAQAPNTQEAPVDPPGRVARLNLVEGPVSFASAQVASGADGHAWTQAELNRPLTGGDRLWTDQRARAELHVGSTAVRLGEQTSLDFLALDDDTTQLRLAQGTVQLRVRAMFEGQRLEIDTPNLAFVVTQPGDYRLDVNPGANTTRVVAQSGAGMIYGEGGAPITLGGQQQISLTGTQLTPAGLGAPVPDDLDRWAQARDQAEDQSLSARYVPRELVGYQQLDNYGDWTQDPAYGAVWLPRALPAGWAPYSSGHWSWIRPWGWTWVDDAPWGFAPFHYGRWARIGPRWAWVPGQLTPRPVYAPALVAFVGGGPNNGGWSAVPGTGGPALGWFPLAPGEAFRPAYRASPRYLSRVNQNIVVPRLVGPSNAGPLYRYQRNPSAVTAMSTTDFAQGRPIRGGAPLSATDLARAPLVDGDRGLPRTESPRPRPVAILPPAAVNARPVVVLQGGDGRVRDDWRNGRRDERRAAQAGTPNPAATPQTPPAPPAPATAATPLPRSAAVQIISPGLSSGGAPGRQERSPAGERVPGGRRIGERPAGEARTAPSLAAPPGESLGQRALREQAARNAAPQPVRPEPRPAFNAGADPGLEARRAQQQQQQMQRDQQRQERELARQQEAQRRQAEAPLGQRALAEQAARQQAAPPPVETGGPTAPRSRREPRQESRPAREAQQPVPRTTPP
ncbi:MAG: putative chromosome segregation ATPase [Polaromonas sp.]|nr:putative chromosome segregation ATPase [Polaromonas sp.]